MKLRDTQILDHIIEYCTDIEETLIKYGDSFESFSSDKGYQYILSFWPPSGRTNPPLIHFYTVFHRHFRFRQYPANPGALFCTPKSGVR